MKKGVQMYTVRSFMGDLKTLEATVKKIADIGYDCVQGGARGFITDEDFQKMLEGYGLFNVTASGNYEQMLADPEAIKAAIKRAHIYNTSEVNVGTLPRELRESEEGFKFYAKCVNQIGAELKKEGLKLVYHPHALECFSLGGGRKGLDIMLEETDPDAFGFVLDTHWLICGGVDPADWIRKAKGRMQTVHFKDYKIIGGANYVEEVCKQFAEIGEGNLDWPEIVAACRDIDIKNVIVEQDICNGDPFDSLAVSFKNMVKLGV